LTGSAAKAGRGNHAATVTAVPPRRKLRLDCLFDARMLASSVAIRLLEAERR
jgi:hypothetical protein